MSYILDALRRADAERERGEVPSLHTQQYGALPGDDAGRDRPLVLIGVIVFLVLALGSALAWHFWGSSDGGPRLAAQGAVRTSPVAPAPAPVTLPTPLPATSAAVPPTSMAAAPAAASAAVQPAAAPAHESRHRPHPARAVAREPDTRHPSHAAATTGSAPASGSGAGALPDSLRHELPTLTFGGASFSKDPASRMVIFNGRVFHEGDTLAPQLVLEQIKLKSAVLSYKGYRYELPF
jgi:general secretion pathway protein B